VTSTSLTNALNWVWLAVAAGALVWFALNETRRRRRAGRRSGLRRLLAVVLVAFAIFPALSSSDDLLSYSLLSVQFGQHGGFGSQVPEDPAETTARVQLARLLETLERFQTAVICSLTVCLFCLTYTCVFRPRFHERIVERPSGRSPPSI
jgi:hypothetical protein